MIGEFVCVVLHGAEKPRGHVEKKQILATYFYDKQNMKSVCSLESIITRRPKYSVVMRHSNQGKNKKNC